MMSLILTQRYFSNCNIKILKITPIFFFLRTQLTSIFGAFVFGASNESHCFVKDFSSFIFTVL